MTSKALDPRLARYIDQVRAIAAQPLSEAAKLRRVRDAAAQLVSRPVELSPEDRRVPARGYGRNLLHKDPETGFVVIAMVWPAGQGGPPHDHGCWGVVAVAEGQVDVTNYEREDDGRDPARAVLRPVGTLRATPGAVAWVLPPHEDFHSVVNPSQERAAVTIHTYGREPHDFNRVDLATGQATIGQLIYDNV